jgi:hypothetical protein
MKLLMSSRRLLVWVLAITEYTINAISAVDFAWSLPEGMIFKVRARVVLIICVFHVLM